MDTFPKVPNKEKPLKSGHILKKYALKLVKSGKNSSQGSQAQSEPEFLSEFPYQNKMFTFLIYNRFFIVEYFVDFRGTPPPSHSLESILANS